MNHARASAAQLAAVCTGELTVEAARASTLPRALVHAVRDECFRRGAYSAGAGAGNGNGAAARRAAVGLLNRARDAAALADALARLSLLAPRAVVRALCDWAVRQHAASGRRDARALFSGLGNCVLYRRSEARPGLLSEWLLDALRAEECAPGGGAAEASRGRTDRVCALLCDLLEPREDEMMPPLCPWQCLVFVAVPLLVPVCTRGGIEVVTSVTANCLERGGLHTEAAFEDRDYCQLAPVISALCRTNVYEARRSSASHSLVGLGARALHSLIKALPADLASHAYHDVFCHAPWPMRLRFLAHSDELGCTLSPALESELPSLVLPDALLRERDMSEMTKSTDFSSQLYSHECFLLLAASAPTLGEILVRRITSTSGNDLGVGLSPHLLSVISAIDSTAFSYTAVTTWITALARQMPFLTSEEQVSLATDFVPSLVRLGAISWSSPVHTDDPVAFAANGQCLSSAVLLLRAAALLIREPELSMTDGCGEALLRACHSVCSGVVALVRKMEGPDCSKVKVLVGMLHYIYNIGFAAVSQRCESCKLPPTSSLNDVFVVATLELASVLVKYTAAKGFDTALVEACDSIEHACEAGYVPMAPTQAVLSLLRGAGTTETKELTGS